MCDKELRWVFEASGYLVSNQLQANKLFWAFFKKHYKLFLKVLNLLSENYAWSIKTVQSQ